MSARYRNFVEFFRRVPSCFNRNFAVRFALAVAFIFGIAPTLRAETPETETLTFPVARDVWISSAPGEDCGSNGATPKLKLKSYQEFSILDFDVSALRGRRIESAAIRVKLSGKERLRRVGVSSIATDWTEGDGTNYAETPGASSFRWRENPNVPWSVAAAPGERSDATAVIFGEGGSFWANADASEPVDGWQTIPVDPRLVAARAVGLSRGFVLFDETGTELNRVGADRETVEIRLFPNRFFYSKDQNRSVSPILEIVCSQDIANVEKTVASPTKLAAKTDGLLFGDVEISWESAVRTDDQTSERVVGFVATVDGVQVEQTLIPAPKINDFAGCGDQKLQNFSTRLAPLGLKPGKTKTLELVAVGEFGSRSEPATLKFDVSADKPSDWNALVGISEKTIEKKKRGAERNALSKNDFRFGDSTVAILEEFDKTTENGELIPERSAETANVGEPLWNAKTKRVELAAARGEFVGFQLAISGKAKKVRAEIRWNAPDANADATTTSNPTANFYRLEKVETPRGKIGDPAIPFSNSTTFLNAGTETVYVEIFVPQDAAPGDRLGTLRLSSENETLEIPLSLTVWNFNITNELSFLPEMNCYSIPENELDYYRLAQLHRTYLNRVPYSHRGTVGDGLAPRWNADAKSFDWSAWEKRFAPLFDGSAFADSPRGAVPIEAFYLPLFENFPGDIFADFDETATTVDAAFSDEYKETFRAASRAFATRSVERGWDGVRFFFFLNNKRDYKRNGWSKASSPWLLDEPATFQDFEALRFFGRLFREGVADVETASGTRPILFRADISRPEWRRDTLDGILDVDVVGGGAFRQYNRTVLDKRDRFDEFVYAYGTAAAPHLNGWQPTIWALDAWSLGADGIVPWQTIGNADSWKNGDELALLYPPKESRNADSQVVPSIRLKAFRRGQQDVEYLTALVKATGKPREDVAQALRRRLPLDATTRFTSAEDAGTQDYADVSPADLRKLRREIGEFLTRQAQ